MWLLFAAGCASTSPAPELTRTVKAASGETETAAVVQGKTDKGEKSPGIFSATPTPPYGRAIAKQLPRDPVEKRLADGQAGVNFHEIPVGRFINEVFGNILGLAFEVESSLSSREDLVTMRSAEDQSHLQLYRMAQRVLMNYGIGIVHQGELIRFVPSKDPNSPAAPLLITGETLPDVPDSRRTVFRFVQLHSVRENLLRGWIDISYKQTGLVVRSDPLTNTIMLQGPAYLVNQAAESVAILDRPNMRGKYSVRIVPSFVSADTLAKMLTDVLQSEGIAATLQPPIGSVIVLPMLPTNSVIVFSSDAQILDHVKDWALELDQPVTQNVSDDFFYYQVRNTSAADLAAAIAGVKDDVDETGGNRTGPEGIYVDKNRNGLIFTGEAQNWKAYLPIIKSMDRAVPLVNVEVTVASVTLTDDTDIGIEWLFNDTHGDFSGLGQSSFGIGASGFSYQLNNLGQVRFALNALSQDQRVSILSKPTILVKSGETASIDVGQEVPIITSQAQSKDTADAPVLQSITYRKTGVLLEVGPTVHSLNRVDLDITQEVSEVLDAVATSVESPSIFNRKVKTTLTLSDGGAVILGGLISSSANEGSNKIPVLGNIPGLGALFRSSGNQETRSELILVIQAYIIDIEGKNWNFNEQLKQKLNLLDIESLELN